MPSAKQFAANAATPKESTHSRNDGGKPHVVKVPDAARLSPPNQVKVINVCQKRDALALAQVTAATVIPSNATEQSRVLLADSTEALYQDFRAADPIDSILARLLCGIANARGTWCESLAQREMELKSAAKGALVVTELAKAYDARRGHGKQTVNVGQVNVEAGGQAVVGNVTSARQPGEVVHPSMDAVGNATTEKRPEQATQGMFLPQPKIEDPAPPKR